MKAKVSLKVKLKVKVKLKLKLKLKVKLKLKLKMKVKHCDVVGGRADVDSRPLSSNFSNYSKLFVSSVALGSEHHSQFSLTKQCSTTHQHPHTMTTPSHPASSPFLHSLVKYLVLR